MKRLAQLLKLAIFQEKPRLHDDRIHEALDWIREPITQRNFLMQACGSEFVNTEHEDLINLCHELGLVVEDLTPDAKLSLNEVYFSQNKIRVEKQIIAALKPLAFAGEHCSSEWSGYMNGAVHSGK